MGLDMYLTKKTYVKNWDITVTKGGAPTAIEASRITYIEEEYGYWRKANHIHNWFVANVQEGEDDCGTHYVSSEQLADLLATCEQVEADHEQAPKKLPTRAGFFFGGTEYDEDYFGDIQNTINIIKSALASDNGDFYYHSSW
jgi:hypothetical protein